jgi:hypothetical protein
VNANKKILVFWVNLIGGNILDSLYVRLTTSVKLLPVVQEYFRFWDLGWTPSQISGYYVGDLLTYRKL